ncbi:MAG: winged helix-turn-helix domain-containing protein [Planctomycetaceae bacterium]|jgi:transposase|nr:winged helix-turn-helix domain-containing protein [Planctomycetaceae bacterium]
MDYRLPKKQIQNLLKKYREIVGQRNADRIRVVIALASGHSVSLVASIFVLDVGTVRRYFRMYEEGGVNGLLEVRYQGRQSYLTDEEKKKLKEHLRNHIYLDVKPIIEYVYATFQVKYSLPGMTKLLHELNFVYKKSKNCPSKADPETQRKWNGRLSIGQWRIDEAIDGQVD